ncbi:MAG: hypothetical protein HYZ20_20520 [Burkholderiales bacterium]|nr:hypothetical protein [Burkholderiales bacterium]
MGAPELLHHLRGAGLVLTLTPAGALHVAPRSALTDDHRAAIRAERDALMLALQAEADPPPPAPPGRSGNPLMTPEQGDECHAGGWDDAEIDAYLAREARFTRLGRVADAEHLAERLTLRDRQHDDRRLCLECVALADNGRCLVAARGRLPGASRRLEPVSTILQRCEGFTLAPGLT